MRKAVEPFCLMAQLSPIGWENIPTFSLCAVGELWRCDSNLTVSKVGL